VQSSCHGGASGVKVVTPEKCGFLIVLETCLKFPGMPRKISCSGERQSEIEVASHDAIGVASAAEPGFPMRLVAALLPK
jgi:hypothetical protein